MAFSHGKNTYFAIQDSNDANGSPTNISAYLREVSFPRQADVADSTVFGASVKSYLMGIADARVTISGLFDATIDGVLSGIYGLESGREWAYGPQGSTASKVRYKGTVAGHSPLLILVNYQVQGSVGDVVTFSAEFQFTAQDGYATTAIERDTF